MLALAMALDTGASEPAGARRRTPALPATTGAALLYGTFVFGTNSANPVWAVFDKSSKDGTHYDVLYLDVNADGDLTAAEERFVGKARTIASETNALFEFPTFKEPGSRREHTAFTITWRPHRVSASIKWLGDKKMNAGYGTESTNYGRFAASPENAPVYVLGHELPFQFQHWTSGTFTRGKANDFKVFMGNPGRGEGAFCAVDQEFLPKQDYVVATLIYATEAGQEKREQFELKERC